MRFSHHSCCNQCFVLIKNTKSDSKHSIAIVNKPLFIPFDLSADLTQITYDLVYCFSSSSRSSHHSSCNYCCSHCNCSSSSKGSLTQPARFEIIYSFFCLGSLMNRNDEEVTWKSATALESPEAAWFRATSISGDTNIWLCPSCLFLVFISFIFSLRCRAVD